MFLAETQQSRGSCGRSSEAVVLDVRLSGVVLFSTVVPGVVFGVTAAACAGVLVRTVSGVVVVLGASSDILL